MNHNSIQRYAICNFSIALAVIISGALSGKNITGAGTSAVLHTSGETVR